MINKMITVIITRTKTKVAMVMTMLDYYDNDNYAAASDI